MILVAWTFGIAYGFGCTDFWLHAILIARTFGDKNKKHGLTVLTSFSF